MFKILQGQVSRINHLVKTQCAAYDNGNCIFLDDGETHQCVQIISKQSINCNYFKDSVLPIDEDLYKEITSSSKHEKVCVICGEKFEPKSNNQKYCESCRQKEIRRKDAERKYKKRHEKLLA